MLSGDSLSERDLKRILAVAEDYQSVRSAPKFLDLYGSTAGTSEGEPEAEVDEKSETSEKDEDVGGDPVSVDGISNAGEKDRKQTSLFEF